VGISIESINVITNISGSPVGPLAAGEVSAKGAKSLVLASDGSPAVVDSAALSRQVALAGRVVAQPSVRAEEVERAKALVASPNYPPRAIVEAVARLVAESNHALD